MNAFLAIGLAASALAPACGADEAPDNGATPDALVGGDGVGGGDSASAPRSPGWVMWRRLNRTEYDNTVRDLFPGTELAPARDFPPDDSGYGFDTTASTLTLSPLHLEVYERAAEQLADEVTRLPTVRAELDGAIALPNPDIGGSWGDGYILWAAGTMTADFDVPVPGEYIVRFEAWQDRAGPDDTRVGVEIDGERVGEVVVAAVDGDRGVYEQTVTLPAGPVTVALRFLNDYYDDSTDPAQDRNLWASWIVLDGPLVAPLPTEGPMAAFFDVCAPGAAVAGERDCAEAAVGRLATRAWRRPLADGELDRLMALYDEALDEGSDLFGATRVAIIATLLSPSFLFRAEFQDDPESKVAEPLTGYEMATRLSYFLWSSMPDEALFAAAARGELDTAAGVEAQARRMLDDPRAVSALVDNFAGQWLYIRDIANVFPDQRSFPAFDEALRASMSEEMRRFFATFLTEGRPLTELLTADETFVDARLAAHYGVAGPAEGEGFARASLVGTQRRGLLGQAGLLTVLATPFRTSIVRRGKWVLGQLLCDEPGTPPNGVQQLVDDEELPEPLTLRQRMEQHVTKEECALCHARMDPIGFGLEHFDGIGGWRDTERGIPIDASGVMPSGTTFDGALELAAILGADDRLYGCVSEKVMIYALGRGMKRADEPYLADITAELGRRGGDFRELLVLVVTSDPFRFRTGQLPTEVP
ncbi:MAG: DUF1592 domain-containing protein [Myxococcales bacterium]|nr:DUF1592 domain-containing protein [Myxococcales bacterium]